MDKWSDDVLNHATIISMIDDGMIHYAAHSESRLDKPLSDVVNEGLSEDADYTFYIIRIQN